MISRSSLALVVAGLTASAGLMTASPAAAATAPPPPGPYTVDVHNREDVRQFYNLVHQVRLRCRTGGLVAASRDAIRDAVSDLSGATLATTNYYRAMAGVPR